LTGQKYEQADAQKQLETCIANLQQISGIKMVGSEIPEPPAAGELSEA